MNAFKTIRQRLGATQAAIAEAIGVTQGNVSFYEKGQTVPPQIAAKLIEHARSLGHTITFDDLYASTEEGADLREQAAPTEPADSKV